MMTRRFLRLIALFFPWLILLINDNPLGAFIALMMQATLVGWLPASIWAWRIIDQNKKGKSRND